MSDLNRERPVALSLLKFHFPITAIASITHRITGVFLVASLLPCLYLLHLSAQSEAGFVHAGELLRHPLLAFFWALVAGSYAYHLMGGLRHLLLDMGIGDTLRAARISAWLVLALGEICTFAALLWLYL